MFAWLSAPGTWFAPPRADLGFHFNRDDLLLMETYVIDSANSCPLSWLPSRQTTADESVNEFLYSAILCRRIERRSEDSLYTNNSRGRFLSVLE